MSLMSKLSAILLLSISLFGADADVIKFLKDGIGKNPNIVSLDVEIVNKIPLSDPKGWEAYVIKLSGKAKTQGQVRPISQRSVYFVSGNIITQELFNMKTGTRLNDELAPVFKDAYYSKENLIYGNADAAHKVAIFSDPLCPFCRSFVPGAIEYMKKQPKDFAVYYYHFPLPSLHPAAVALTKAAIAAEHQGRKDIVLSMYKVTIDAGVTDEIKILKAFNETLNTNIKVTDIHTKAVEDQFKHDQEVAMHLMVNGTPTVFFDGKKDSSKVKYKQVKGN